MIKLTSSNGSSVATINPVGAALAGLWQDGTQIAGSPDIYSGVTLFPWPNRIFGGTWSYLGNRFKLAVNDVQQGAALHGLVYQEHFDWAQTSPGTCSLSFEVKPSEGFPFRSRLRITFELVDNGLSVIQEVTNIGSEQLPFAIGFHPYFLADENSVFKATEFEFRFADVHVDQTVGPNCHQAQLTTSVYSLELSSDITEYVHIFTNRYDEPGQTWFAIEPQTSPADSLNTGVGVIELSPGESKHFNYRLNWH